MADTANEYADAWQEGEENHPAQNAVAAAAKRAASDAQAEYITAYADIDAGMSVNGEDVKTIKPKDKAQEKGTIATNKSGGAKPQGEDDKEDQ